MEYNFENSIDSPENKRSVTDLWMLVLFGLYFVLWISTAIYALIAEKTEITLIHELLHSINPLIFTISVVVIAFFTLIALWIFTSLSVYDFVCDFLIIILVKISLSILIGRAYNFQQCLGIILLLILLRKESFQLTQLIFTETARVLLKSKLLILVMLLFNILTIAVIIFGFYIHECILHISHIPKGNLYLFESINAIGTFWVTLTVYNFALAVLCGTLASNNSQKRSDMSVVWRCIQIVWRYHLGTVAYTSSIFAFLQKLRILLVYVMRSISEKSISFRTILMIAFNLYDPIILPILTYGGLTMCVAKGKGFYEGAKLSFDYFEEKASRGFLVSMMTYYILDFCAWLFIACLMLSVRVLHLFLDEQEKKNTVTVMLLHYGPPFLLFVWPLLIVMYFGVHATLICFLEDVAMYNVRNDALSPALIPDKPPRWYQTLCCARIE